MRICTCQFCKAGQAHPATEEHSMYELVGDQYACGSCSHLIPAEEVTPE